MAKFGGLKEIFDSICDSEVEYDGTKFPLGIPVTARIREIVIPEFGENIGWIRHLQSHDRATAQIEALELYFSRADASEPCGRSISDKAVAWLW